MRQRLISAAIGLAIILVILFFYNTLVLNFAIVLIILLALQEAFRATHYVNNRGLFAICLVFACMVPFFHISRLRIVTQIFCFLFIAALFILLLANHKTMTFEQLSAAFLLTMLLSFSFSSIVFMRDFYLHRQIAKDIGLFYILLIFLGAWITDAGAYFVGRFFGKIKLAPEISPKKTVEGAVGGVVSTLLVFMLTGFLYQKYAALFAASPVVRYPVLLILALLCAFAAILGDLAASLIKRECHIKDFGNILPGHGGMLDRFDSVMFVAPLVMIFIQICPVIRA